MNKEEANKILKIMNDFYKKDHDSGLALMFMFDLNISYEQALKIVHARIPYPFIPKVYELVDLD